MQLVVGRIIRPHGVRGELAVEVRTDDPELRLATGAVLATQPAAAGPLTVTRARWHTGKLLLTFDGVADRDGADGLRGVLLVVDSAELEEIADPDEFRDHELIGLAVYGPGDEHVGTVTDILHHGQKLPALPALGMHLAQFARQRYPDRILLSVHQLPNQRRHLRHPLGILFEQLPD